MKALIIDNEVRAIEERNIDVFQYYHEDFAKLFVDCSDDVTIGDKYENGVFIKESEGDV